MNRYHKNLRNEELNLQFLDMLKSCIKGIREQVNLIKHFLNTRKKELIQENSSENEKISMAALKYVHMFHKYILEELINMEQLCEETFIRLNIDLITSIKGRMQPPSYISPEEMRKSCQIYHDIFDEPDDDELCHCTWKNTTVWNLDDTQNILKQPRKEEHTEFDEHDLKFMQDIVWLRTSMFSLPEKRIDLNDTAFKLVTDIADINDIQPSSIIEFLQLLKHKEVYTVSSLKDEFSKLNNLKFVDGEFKINDVWTKVLDLYGRQYSSKWYLVLCPQIEKIAKKRSIPLLQLDARATFDFMSNVTMINFVLSKTDLIPLLTHKQDAIWLKSLKLQFKKIEQRSAAATLIQAQWRGYWIRKKKIESAHLYIAASLMWFFWISLKAKKEMHRRYLKKMLVSLQETRDLTQKLSIEFDSMILQPHIVVHLPSMGYPLELREIINPKLLTVYQNVMLLRICFVRNQNSEVIYILPVKPIKDILIMYNDFIESISPSEQVAKRITFIALSQIDTFKKLSLNVSRILHCSQESINEIKKKIEGKLAYFLPYIVDECDMRLAGTLNLPLLSPDMEAQRILLNASNICEIIENLGLSQPPHRRHITDFESLCSSLSELMVLHTEISTWLFKLNYGIVGKHCGFFLINHISVPFMPQLRREREKYEDVWEAQPSLREEYLKKMRNHIPLVIRSVTRLSRVYANWDKFYEHVQKFGCIIQAIPPDPESVQLSLFIPAKMTKKKPKWLGSANRINLESAYGTTIYMLPQTSVDISNLHPIVNKFAKDIQNRGYFGYLSVDCYCYMHKQEERLIILILNVFPYYTSLQSYIEWMKFAINGWYNVESDNFISDVVVPSQMEKRNSSLLLANKTPEWNETVKRFAVAITQLHHSRFSSYKWHHLKSLFESCNIFYDRIKRQGCNILLHDGEIRSLAQMVAVSPAMINTLKMIHKCLEKLHKTLLMKTKQKPETNLPILSDYFLKFSVSYNDYDTDKCLKSF